MNLVNITSEITQLVFAVISLIGIILLILRKQDLPVLRRIAEALACFILGEVYWVLHIYIKGYEQAGSFSISDLSWIGFYLLLLSTYHSEFGRIFDWKKKEHIKLNVISCIAPIFIITINVILFLLGDSLFYTIIYCIPTAFLSFYTLRFILVSGSENNVIRGFRGFHIIVGSILIVDNLVCLMLDIGFTDAENILKFCFAALLLAVWPTVYKGVKTWPQ